MNPPEISDPRTASHPAGVADTVKSTARETATEIKHLAGEAAHRAREEVNRLAAGKKSSTAERLHRCGEAIHESARALEEEDPNIAWFTHRAADRLQGAADYVRNSTFADLRLDVEDLARRHPALFFGGLLLAGLAIGNLAKTSGRRNEDDFPGNSGSETSPDPAI